jgi:hypothetical protein
VLLTEYQLDELHFAYVYHCYLRWQTYRSRPAAPLKRLDAKTLGSLVERFDVKVLECETDGVELATLVSLRPQESIAACASKLKGQASKWLREQMHQVQPDEPA